MSNVYKIMRNLIILIISIILVLEILFPIYWVLSSSLTNAEYLFRKPLHYYPIGFNFENYIKVIKSVPVGRYFFNSLIISIISAFFSVFLGFIASYGFVRMRLPLKNILLFFILATMFLPQMVMVFPLYETFREIKLLNTIWAIIILNISNNLPIVIWLMVSFIRQVPIEIEESALIDGANVFRIVKNVMGPILRPALGVFYLITFITSWNELLWPLVFSTDERSKTLAVGLLELPRIIERAGVPWNLTSAGSVLMILPIIILAIVFQKQIVGGLTEGAVK